MTSIKQETLTSVKWTTIERFGVEGIRFVLGIIMARLLTPSDYGILGMIAVFIAISRTFVDSGFQNAIKWCEENGKEFTILARTDGVSSSELKAKIAERQKK